MSWSIKLFRVSGIDVKVHLTFVLILFWAAYIWGSAPGAGPMDAIIGVVAMLLLFVCVTVHELAHSLLAIRYGSRVRDIILLPIGGVSEIEEMPERPGQELLVALIGPLASFALGLIFLAVDSLVSPETNLGSLGLPVAGSSWLVLPGYLALVNIFLAIFNLIPAFPMDGGRVLRAVLAMRLGQQRATKIAATIGQILALAFGLIGIMVGNLILIVIAVFIGLGAAQEGAVGEMQGVLSNSRVDLAMTRNPLAVAVTDPLIKAVELTLSSEQADFPVVDPNDPGHVVGLLTRDDLLRGLKSSNDGAVANVMRQSFPTVTPADLLFRAQQSMAGASLSAVPVVDQGRLVGLLTSADVNEAFVFIYAGLLGPRAKRGDQ